MYVPSAGYCLAVVVAGLSASLDFAAWVGLVCWGVMFPWNASSLL